MDTGSPVGILSNTELESAIETGHIICTPFDKSHLNQASIDVTLGYHFYRTEPKNNNSVYNTFDQKHVDDHFDGPYKAMSHKQWCDTYGYKKFKNIPDNHPIIVIGPGESILAHTHEFIGIKPPGTFQIMDLSTWARNGLTVCLDSGYAYPGYVNRVNLQIHNYNTKESIVLPVGEQIARVAFVQTGPVKTSNGVEGTSYKYLSSGDIDTIVKTWSPASMLPAVGITKRSLPPKIEGAIYE